MPEIRICVPRGAGKPVRVEVNGVAGSDCTKLTEKLEKALGTVRSQELTPEFYEKPLTEQVHERQELR